MADTQKLAYKLAATISGASVAAGAPIGASAATGAVDTGAYPTGGTSGQQHTILPKVTTVADTYSKVEVDAKLRVLKAEAETVRVGVDAKLDRVLDAISTLTEKVATQIGTLDEKLDSAVSDVRDDNKTTRRVTLVTIIISVMAAVAAIYAAQANNIAAMQVGIEATRDAMAVQTPTAAPLPAPAVEAAKK